MGHSGTAVPELRLTLFSQVKGIVIPMLAGYAAERGHLGINFACGVVGQLALFGCSGRFFGSFPLDVPTDER
jgi:hypothetical protein